MTVRHPYQPLVRVAQLPIESFSYGSSACDWPVQGRWAAKLWNNVNRSVKRWFYIKMCYIQSHVTCQWRKVIDVLVCVQKCNIS